MGGRWRTFGTREYGQWYQTTLNDQERDAIVDALRHLQADGPALRRPLSGQIKSSRFKHMKELIPRRAHVRILYIFDPNRDAILLLGGDKTNDWVGWYDRNVQLADAIYERHLTTVRGPTPTASRREQR